MVSETAPPLTDDIAACTSRLRKAARLLCRDSQEADEVVQDTCLRALQGLAGFRAEAKLYTWLYGIMINVIRQRRRRSRWLSFTAFLPEWPSWPERDWNRRLDRASLAAELGRLLQNMPLPQREVLVLRYLEGMPLAAIAEVTGTALGTVKSRLYYGTAYLRRRLPACWMEMAGEVNP